MSSKPATPPRARIGSARLLFWAVAEIEMMDIRNLGETVLREDIVRDVDRCSNMFATGRIRGRMGRPNYPAIRMGILAFYFNLRKKKSSVRLTASS